MDVDDFETTVKVIVVGNGQVGKTSMSTRYCKGRWTDTYKKTIGVDFMEKRIEVEDLGETVCLMVWDTAGQEEFDSLTSRYYKGAGAALLVFSTVDRASFLALPSWRKKVTDEVGEIPMVLVQNKIDLIDQAAMPNDEVEDMARRLGLRLYRTCVKENVNVKDAFEYVTTQYILGGGGNNQEALAHIDDFTTNAMEDAAAQGGVKTEEAAAAPAAASSESKGAPGGAATSLKVQLPKSTRAAAPAAVPAAAKAKPRAPEDGGTFKLTATRPSKQRTGGKKSGFRCAIL